MMADAGTGPVDRLAFPLPPRTIGEGETLFAAESPEFVTARVTDNDWPTLTDPAPTMKALDNAAGVCTVTVAADGVEADTVCPVLASVPDTVLENVTLPTTSPRKDQVKICELPPGMAALDGVGPETVVAPTPPIDRVGVTACAVAPPELLTVTVTFSVCPVSAIAGVAAIAALRAVGFWMSSGEVVGLPGSTETLELTSVASRLTVNVTEPVTSGFSVHVNVLVVPPGTV